MDELHIYQDFLDPDEKNELKMEEICAGSLPVPGKTEDGVKNM